MLWFVVVSFVFVICWQVKLHHCAQFLLSQLFFYLFIFINKCVDFVALALTNIMAILTGATSGSLISLTGLEQFHWRIQRNCLYKCYCFLSFSLCEEKSACRDKKPVCSAITIVAYCNCMYTQDLHSSCCCCINRLFCYKISQNTHMDFEKNNNIYRVISSIMKVLFNHFSNLHGGVLEGTIKELQHNNRTC